MRGEARGEREASKCTLFTVMPLSELPQEKNFSEVNEFEFEGTG